MVTPINFYRARSNDQVTITRIKSNLNLTIFLVSCCQHTWTFGALFACCRACKVPDYQCSIHHLQLKFTFFLLFLFFNCGWTFGESNRKWILSDFLVNFRNEAVCIYLRLIWSLILSSQIWQSSRGEMLNVNIHKTISNLTLKRKTERLVLMRKKQEKR